MNILKSSSRTILRSRFQPSTLPNLYLRTITTMSHNVPKLNDPSLLKTDVAYVNGEWVKAKSGKTFEVHGMVSTFRPQHIQ
jgi:succinate-semialdehyde dehydrogenase/glutarate-semialdehyde dehydrogenase